MRVPRIATLSLTTLFLLPLALMRPVAAQQVSSATTIPDQEDPKTLEIKKQLQKYYDDMDKGFSFFDPVAATKYYSADYRAIEKDGTKQTRTELRDLYKMILTRALRSKMKTEITVCTLQGDTATVQTKMTLMCHVRRDDGAEAVIDGDAMSREFWMKRKGTWQVKQARVFDFNLRLNGQPYAE